MCPWASQLTSGPCFLVSQMEIAVAALAYPQGFLGQHGGLRNYSERDPALRRCAVESAYSLIIQALLLFEAHGCETQRRRPRLQPQHHVRAWVGGRQRRPTGFRVTVSRVCGGRPRRWDLEPNSPLERAQSSCSWRCGNRTAENIR